MAININETTMFELVKSEAYAKPKAKAMTRALHMVHMKTRFALALDLYERAQEDMSFGAGCHIGASDDGVLMADRLDADMCLPLWGSVVLSKDQ